MKEKVRVRIAPSPTGLAHVGTAYSALFNWAYAKKEKGVFILRLEDTDVKRNVADAEKAIYKGLSWLGLTWDEGPDVGGTHSPYRQSERLDLYKKKAAELLKEKKAYEEDGAIRFKNPGRDVSWDDGVRGKVTFPGGEVTDFVILRSDGYPTYNFSVVVDDLDMEITHVIRGEEHISNTPRQIAIYEALGKKPPHFIHLPTLRNKKRKKLSKRKDPVNLEVFRSHGYLPEALVNFLCLLGWSHPKEKEIFNLDEFVRQFDIKRIRRAGPIFDKEKLDWINGEYIREMTDSKLSKLLFDFYKGKYKKEDLIKITPLVKERIKTLKEFDILAGFFFKAPKVDTSYFEKNWKKHLREVLGVFEKIKSWELDEINKNLLSLINGQGYKTGDFFMNLRVAITGRRFTPPINESMEILGKDETIKRIEKALK